MQIKTGNSKIFAKCKTDEASMHITCNMQFYKILTHKKGINDFAVHIIFFRTFNSYRFGNFFKLSLMQFHDLHVKKKTSW